MLLIVDRRIYNSFLISLYISFISYTIIKRKNVSTNINVLDMRYFKMSRPRDNASVSSDIAIPSTSLVLSDIAIPGITLAS